MLILFLVICIILLIVFYKLFQTYKIDDGTYGIAVILLSVAIIIIGVFIFVDAYRISNEGAIKEKLSMYEQENAHIENDIAEMIDQYKAYEGDVIDGVSAKNNESSLALVNLYPDLKTSELVNQQINIHTENNQKIKDLKESLINLKVAKWWLYFGGNNK